MEILEAMQKHRRATVMVEGHISSVHTYNVNISQSFTLGTTEHINLSIRETSSTGCRLLVYAQCSRVRYDKLIFERSQPSANVLFIENVSLSTCNGGSHIVKTN